MGIPTDGIINPGLARRLGDFLDDSGVVTYYLDLSGGGRELVGGRFRKTSGMSKRERRFITGFMDRLDQLTGLSFVRTDSKETALVDIYSLRRYENRRVIGSTFFTPNGYDVTWLDRKKGKVAKKEGATIKHEILHVLGLDHPYGSGFNPDYTTKDTIMSYNHRRRYFDATRSDYAAVAELWGA
ncbi:hypothetical protein CPCC7001_178 [Cyanobium sp. PCC 7001]|uniref:hypothetical protein n=1 Tax=Cyanobium sp. PCC 7001 TaxID=180281 RepID=UPI0001805038|nr:hypothetical protein [Cyanobium sp. PCC 7001]EDY37300.1 hypothetical protein CPCC7001_178 [Cyanobium sp. PCC 7001]